MTATPLSVFDCPLDGTQLVEASAGTGKTWNITGLYLRLLLERKLAIDGILVVTFTTAATAELRERIRQRLVAVREHLRDPQAPLADPFVAELLASLRARGVRADGDDTGLQRRLELAIESFDEAAIFTIHGFCQRALADVPLSARMPLALEPGDDDALLLEAARDFWRRHVIAAAPDVPARAQAFFGDWLARTRASPEQWAANLRQRLRRPLSRLEWPAAVVDAPFDLGMLEADVAEATALFERARELWLADRTEIVAIVDDARADLSANAYAPHLIQRTELAWERLFTIADPFPGPKEVDDLDRFSSDRLEPKRGRPRPRPHPFFDTVRSLLAARERLRGQAQTQRLRLLRRFLEEAPAVVERQKREQRTIAFDDMLWNLHQRLDADERLAQRLRERYPAALIDEFQDTDPLQYAIFDRIYGAGEPGDTPALFLVGDPKQAIYGFRGADLPTYLAARERASARYSLDENQRSTAPLLAALNALYARNPRSFILDGLDYRPVKLGSKPRPTLVETPATRRPAAAEATRAALQLWQLPEVGGTPMRKPAAEASAKACAAEIVRLLEGGMAGRIRIGDRPLDGGDIAVLVPTHARGRMMRRALTEVDVPSVELSQDSVFASSDAEDLGRILAAIAQPTRTGRILAALATDAMGHDAAAIAAIGADDERLGEAMVRFSGYREHWREHGIAALLRHWMRSERVAARLLARPDGERRLTNLMHLAEILQQASTRHEGLEALMRWFDGMRRDHAEAGDEAQLRLESDRHLVQIVTIHVSKGLEYPIVFCPFLWDGATRPPPSDLDGVECHDADGHGIIAYRELDATEAARRSLAQTAERMRLLYVALTRAVHRCYLVVGCYAGGSRIEARCSPLNWLVAGGATTPADWFAGARSMAPAAAGIAAAWADFADAFADASASAGAHADADAGAATAAAAVALAPLPQPSVRPLKARVLAPDAYAALAPPAWIPPARRIASYSSLIRTGSGADAAARETDLFVDVAASGAAVPAAADDILRFPRGPAAGECLHALLEQVEFDDPATWAPAIASTLASHPLPGMPFADGAAPRRGGVEASMRMLSRMLADVVATPLLPAASYPSSAAPAPALLLASVSRSRRLDELEFTLPVARLAPSALTALMARHGYPAPLIASGTVDGYLRGFIDLVFEHGGRYYLADWKSNHLGQGRAAYGPGPLALAMRSHDYHLQALLYAVALHRHLRSRLADYRYETHFGGTFYLFVRGMRPGWTDPAGRPAGVHFDRPSPALMEALSTLLDRAGAGEPVPAGADRSRPARGALAMRR